MKGSTGCPMTVVYTNKKKKKEIRLTSSDWDAVSPYFWPPKSMPKASRKLMDKLARLIDERRPKHSLLKNWQTFSYTSRWNVIQLWEKKQQQKLQAQAAKSSDE